MPRGSRSPLCARCPTLPPRPPCCAPLGLGRRREEVRHVFSKNLGQCLQGRDPRVSLPSLQAADTHIMHARACGQRPLRQASVFSPVPNCPGYPLLCHGNITTTRPSPSLKGVLTRGPGRKDVSVSVPVASAPSTRTANRGASRTLYVTAAQCAAPTLRVCAGQSQRGRLRTRLALACVKRRAQCCQFPLPFVPSRSKVRRPVIGYAFVLTLAPAVQFTLRRVPDLPGLADAWLERTGWRCGDTGPCRRTPTPAPCPRATTRSRR